MRNGRIEAELKSELEATKGKTGYKIVEVEKEVAADSLLQVITRPYRGKMVLVDMWNTWCGPCMRAMKSLKPLKEELKEVVYLYGWQPRMEQDCYHRAYLYHLHWHPKQETFGV